MSRPLFALSVLATALAYGQPLQAAEATATGTLPAVNASTPIDSLAEDAAVGPYGQPEWTTHRRFASTRVYLQQDPGEIGFEQWWRARTYKDSAPEHRFQEEIEIGLPGRFQLDLYYTWANTDHHTHFDEASVELRYALADWGKIPGNPTLYGEYAYANHDYNGDTLEWKLLLGDDVGKRWHWGLNFIYEGEIGHSRAEEFAAAAGLSYTIIDQVLGAGIEMQYKHETTMGDRNNPEVQFEIGPSIQWRPAKNIHLDLVAMFGTTAQGPKVESFVIFGWDFGGGDSGDHHYRPTAGFQH